MNGKERSSVFLDLDAGWVLLAEIRACSSKETSDGKVGSWSSVWMQEWCSSKARDVRGYPSLASLGRLYAGAVVIPQT